MTKERKQVSKKRKRHRSLEISSEHGFGAMHFFRPDPGVFILFHELQGVNLRGIDFGDYCRSGIMSVLGGDEVFPDLVAWCMGLALHLDLVSSLIIYFFWTERFLELFFLVHQSINWRTNNFCSACQ